MAATGLSTICRSLLNGTCKSNHKSVQEFCTALTEFSGAVEQQTNIESLDSNGWRALHYAARYRQWGMVKWLVENGADVTAKDKYGDTALHCAAYGMGHRKWSSGWSRTAQTSQQRGTIV